MEFFKKLRAHRQVKPIYGAGVLPKQRPASLFRYRNAENLQFLRPILLDHSVYAAPIGKGDVFNDPCECFYDIDLSWDEASARAGIRYMKSLPPGIRPQVRKGIEAVGEIKPHELEFFERFWKENDENAILAIMRAGHNTFSPNMRNALEESQRILDQATVGICSLSALGQSPYMSWSYAGNHRGVCLEFSTGYLPFSNAGPVIYSENPPTVKLMGNPFQSQINRMMTKGRAWEHEEEWRVFSHPDTGLSIPFPPPALKSLTFCPFFLNQDDGEQKKKTILDWLRERKVQHPLGVYEFEINRKRYEFSRKPITL